MILTQGSHARIWDLEFYTMRDGPSQMNNLTWTIDGISIAAILGSLSGILPAIATVGAILWYGIQIYEWLSRRRARVVIVAEEDNNHE